MQGLLEAVRGLCAAMVWSQGESLASSGRLKGLKTREGTFAVRVESPDGSLTPLVTLMPERDKWMCECPRRDRGCSHAAAVVIALSNDPHAEGIAEQSSEGATVEYELYTVGEALGMRRVVRRGGTTLPLVGRLAAARRAPDLVDVNASQTDLELDIVLRRHIQGALSAPFVPKLFVHLRQVKDVTMDGEPVRIGPPVPLTSARVLDTPKGFRVEAGPTPRVQRRFSNGAVVHRGALCAVAEPGLSERDMAALRNGREFDFGEATELLRDVIPALEKRLPVQVDSKLLGKAEPMKPRIALSSKGVDGKVDVLATLVYGDPPCAEVDGTVLRHLGGPLPLRDAEKESELRHALWREAALEVGEPKRMDAKDAVGLSDLTARLGDSNFAGKGPADAFTTHGTLDVNLDVREGQFHLTFKTEDGREGDADVVLDAWRDNAPLVPLMDGGFAQLPADWLQKHGARVLDLLRAREPKSGALPKASLLDLARLMEELNRPPPPELGPLKALLDEAATGLPKEALPTGFAGTLRDYQLEGVRWLQFMSRAQIGALLADDMGLGKTVQALCALKPPALVVCPASVLFNWGDEVAKFRPDLTVSTYHRTGRRLDPKADVTLTTYAILRLDRELLAEREWDTVVLDEAHTIKNPQSQVAQAAFALNARFRMALTGTPVENRLEDLWSQMHFLNRGLLGGRRDFQDRYAMPIQAGQAEPQERLRSRVRPLLLRRIKGEVAAELPPRTDLVLHCELSDAERTLYDAVRGAAQRDVVAQLNAGGGVMAALEALLRLRQACCHPSLLPGESAEDSSKLKVLRENLEEVLSEGHKALVFSQWTSLLDLVEPGLEAAGVRFVRLDGSTRDREKVVEAFQNDDEVRVMLLSLKAGGVGLNLTAADHVFLLDPWWNPAAEDQAADRAHRIGQERPVFVHRLVAENTVEERILELQEKKRDLASAATESGTQASSLTRDDLLTLLS